MSREFDLLLPSNVLSLPDDATRRDACLSHLKTMLGSRRSSSSSSSTTTTTNNSNNSLSVSPRRSKKKDRPTGDKQQHQQPAPIRRLVRFSFEAEEDDEMSIHVDDIVHVLVVGEPDGWWRGRINDREGNFPITFTEPMDDAPTAAAAASTTNTEQRGINTLRRVKKRIVK
jgi:hypothetical protein